MEILNCRHRNSILCSPAAAAAAGHLALAQAQVTRLSFTDRPRLCARRAAEARAQVGAAM
jgi:hypothetical protein